MTPPLPIAAAALGLAATCTTVFVQQPSPTVAIVNARVFTGVASAPWAEALTVVGDRVGAVGTTAAVRPLAGPSTRLIDAGGRVVIPGINDAHMHIGTGPDGVSLEEGAGPDQDPSLDDVLQRVKAAVAKAPAGAWIYGSFGARVLDDAKATRFALDAVAPGHPVMLNAWTGHGMLVNTAAMRRLQIRDDESDPPGGFFVREAGSRTITGMAHEYAAYGLYYRLSMTPDEPAQAQMLRDRVAEATGFGITSVQLMSNNRPAADLARSAIAADVPIRIRVIDFPMTGVSAWRPTADVSVSASRVTASGTKWILDGTPVERLMLLREPYADAPATRGRRNFPVADITAFLKRALEHREQPMFHAVGDQAIDDVLGALEASGGEAWRPLRPRIEHGDMLEPGHFERAKKLGVIVVQNPSHFMLPAVMGARLAGRAARVTMMKAMLAADVAVALGSDGPVNPYLNVMFASINANNPGQAMTREQAISAYTLGSARAELAETRKGTLAPGMLADLAILSQDIFTVPAEALPATVSVLTMVGGAVVHERK